MFESEPQLSLNIILNLTLTLKHTHSCPAKQRMFADVAIESSSWLSILDIDEPQLYMRKEWRPTTEDKSNRNASSNEFLVSKLVCMLSLLAASADLEKRKPF